ncbi:urease accessory protein UreD [Denitratisoma sp. agr-D3]
MPAPAALSYTVPQAEPWQANLDLAFQRRNDATVLTRREHQGPLRVQKALYPEGPGCCHVILLHPPSGIAGGDHLTIHAELGGHSHALLTTPGAGKWYRSLGPEARQSIAFRLRADSLLEWLPQENIFFDQALARSELLVEMEPGSRFVGWDVFCLGRRAAGEQFRSGQLQLCTRLTGPNGPLWLEQGRISGGDPLLDSPVGMAGRSVCATLLAAGLDLDAELIDRCRALSPRESDAQTGVTRLPSLLVARYLGHSAESARLWLTALWQQLRPTVAGKEAQPPRIWNT